MVALQIATFFSNNLDFFTSSPGYGPRGGKTTLDPSQAKSMLANKKKAVSYLHAIQRVCVIMLYFKVLHVGGVQLRCSVRWFTTWGTMCLWGGRSLADV